MGLSKSGNTTNTQLLFTIPLTKSDKAEVEWACNCKEGAEGTNRLCKEAAGLVVVVEVEVLALALATPPPMS